MPTKTSIKKLRLQRQNKIDWDTESDQWNEFIKKIPDAVKQFQLYSKIPETWFNKNNIQPDTNLEGQFIKREPTDEEYHMQRTIIVHNKHNRMRMDTSIKDALKKKNESLLQKYSSALENFEDNIKCQNILRGLRNLKENEECFESCKIDDFQHISNKKKFLIGFLKVRLSNDIQSEDCDLPKVKGSKQQVEDGDGDTLVEWAFKHRNDPVIAKCPEKPVTEEYQPVQMLDIDLVTITSEARNILNWKV